MKPEETIAGFLQVWGNNPELFLAEDVEKDLDNLNKVIISSSNATNEDIAKEIREWCKKHPNVRDAVRLASRKPRPKDHTPAPEDSKILDNRSPEIPQVLRDKLQGNEEKEVKSGET